MLNRAADEIAQLLKPIALPPLAEQPLVSLLTANYNYGHYVGAAIESALAQGYKKFEMIVCDDGSTDNSCAIIERYARSDERIRLIRKENGGVASALNAAYCESKGEIICLLDADDRFLPTKLETVVNAFRSRPESGFLGHQLFRTDQDGKRLGVSPWIALPPDGWYGPFVLKNGDVPPGLAFGSAICLRREISDLIFPLPGKLRTGVDGTIMVLAPVMTPVIGLPVPLVEYRCHQSNLTNTVQLTAESLERELDVSRMLWEIRKEYLDRVDPRLGSMLPAFDRRLGALSTAYTQSRLRNAGGSTRAYSNLINSDQFKLLHAGARLFWRLSIFMPLPLFRYALNLTSRPNRLKQALWWIFKYVPAAAQHRFLET